MAFIYKVKKGDTLNQISQRFGFANYKEAGITGFKSGNPDLIFPGEEITLANYDPNKVSNIQERAPVIDSTEHAVRFQEDSDGIDKREGISDEPKKEKREEILPPEIDTGTPKGEKDKIEVTGDALVDAYNRSVADIQASVNEANRIASERTEQEKQLYNTALAAIDRTAQATIQRIQQTYDKRLSEQKRLNQLNIDRLKAYGVGGGARFTPIAFQDAISLREQEASDKIASLESERNSLIAEAKAARDKGESLLLRERMDKIVEIENNLRKTLVEAEKAANEQYKLFRTLRKEQEEADKKRLEEIRERFAAQAVFLADDYENLDTEAKTKFIEDLVAKGWGSFSDVYVALENAVRESKTKDLDRRKKEQEIRSVAALESQRLASAAKLRAEAEKAKRGEKIEYSDTELKKLRQAGLSDAPQNVKDDFLYGDLGREEESVTAYLEGKGDTGGTIRERAEELGFDYDGAKAAGYSDKEIEEFLNKK